MFKLVDHFDESKLPKQTEKNIHDRKKQNVCNQQIFIDNKGIKNEQKLKEFFCFGINFGKTVLHILFNGINM